MGLVSQKDCTLGLTQADNSIECEAERVFYGCSCIFDGSKFYCDSRVFLRVHNQ